MYDVYPNGKTDVTSAAVIIGGGPAGLMAAEILLKAGLAVTLYEAMPSVGRKFLVAGKGGLNFTRAEARETFLAHYGSRRNRLEPIINDFGPEEIRQWMQDLGFDSFVGSSNRVFPNTMGAGPILRAWLKRLKSKGLSVRLRHAWQGWTADRQLCFDTPYGKTCVSADIVVLALGGASRARLGSTGAWAETLKHRGVDVAPFKPSNCGFDVAWTDHFRERFNGQPIKPVVLTFTDMHGQIYRQKGELLVTETGLQGGLVYALSAPLRDAIENLGTALIHLDLAPDRPRSTLIERLSQNRGSRSLSSHIARKTGLKNLKAGLIWECLSREDIADPRRLAAAIKQLPLTLLSPRPLDEAISTAGGVTFESLEDNLMIRTIPGTFCAGEMLDWDAPTGGYLLTACFASGYAAAKGALAWLKSHEK